LEHNITYCHVCPQKATATSRERKELQMFENNLFRKVDLSRTEIGGMVLAVVEFCYVIYVHVAMDWACSLD
jgi:hypothetical protein